MVVTVTPLKIGTIHATGVSNPESYPFIRGWKLEGTPFEGYDERLLAGRQGTAGSSYNSAGSTQSRPLVIDSTTNMVDFAKANDASRTGYVAATYLPASNELVGATKVALSPLAKTPQSSALALAARRQKLQALQMISSQSAPSLQPTAEEMVGMELRGSVGRAKYIKPRSDPSALRMTDVRGSAFSSAFTNPPHWAMSALPPKGQSAPQTPQSRRGTPKKNPKGGAGIDQTDLNTSIPFAGFPSLSYLRGF